LKLNLIESPPKNYFYRDVISWIALLLAFLGGIFIGTGMLGIIFNYYGEQLRTKRSVDCLINKKA